MMETFLDQLLHQLAVWSPKVGMGAVLFFAFWLAGVVFRNVFIRIGANADFNTRYVLRLTGRIVSLSLLLFGAVTALGTMGVNVSALVAGLGLTGFALGFALKDILSNFVSGLHILLYRPFRLQQFITVAGLEGKVTEIDLRYTRLEKEGRAFLIPNSMLITNTIGLVEPEPMENGSQAVGNWSGRIGTDG